MKSKIWPNFDAIYCINLDRRKDRWKSCLDEFKRVWIDKNHIRRFSAIEKKNWHLGCMLSHRAIIEESKNLWFKKVLVLEDDFVFQARYEKGLRNVQHVIENNVEFDILYLGWSFKPFLSWRNIIEVKECKKVMRVFWLYCTYGLIYNESFYDTFLNKFPKNDSDGLRLLQKHKTFDWYLALQLAKTNLFLSLKRPLIYQKRLGSNTEWVNKNLFLKSYIQYKIVQIQPLLKVYRVLKKTKDKISYLFKEQM